MSSFLTKKHLQVMLGQDSPLEQAWANYYGLELLSDGMMALPFAIEQFYPHVEADEWEMAVIYMIIRGSDLTAGPVVSIEPQFFAEHFRLSLRQIRRKFKTMVEKGLITITPCYDDNGKKTTSRFYDINPFLDKIFACICADDALPRPQPELLEDTDIDDLDMLSTTNIKETSMSSDTNIHTGTSMSPDTNIYSGTSMFSDTDIYSGTSMSSGAEISSRTPMSPDAEISSRTSMSPDVEISSRTSMSPDVEISSRTSMSSGDEISSRTSMSSGAEISSRTSMSPDAEISSRTSMSSHPDAHTGTSMSPDQPTSYAHTHTYAHAPDSSSSSNSNINTCINILLSSNSNSNSNSNREMFQFFDAEDENRTWLSAACPDESQANEDVHTSSKGNFSRQADKQNDANARFERRILNTIERAYEADKQACRADKQVGKAIEQVGKANKQVGKANKQVGKAIEQVGKAGAPIVDGLATPPTMLPTRSREALALISNDLHDAQTDSSRGRARTLYNQFLTINQTADVYHISDPDISFSELMLAVKHHIRHQTFKSRDQNGQPNGMPLFFHELRKRVQEQVTTVETLRKEGAYSVSER